MKIIIRIIVAAGCSIIIPLLIGQAERLSAGAYGDAAWYGVGIFGAVAATLLGILLAAEEF